MQTRTRAVRSTAAAVFTRDISHKYSESLSDLSAFTGASECTIAERRHRVKLRSSSRFCVRAREWAVAKRKRHSNRSGEETIRIVGLAELPSANNGTACPPGVITEHRYASPRFVVPIIDLGGPLSYAARWTIFMGTYVFRPYMYTGESITRT